MKFLSARRALKVFGLLVACLVLIAPQEAQAQRWVQTARIVTPVEDEGPVRAFLDTLTRVMERSDSLTVARSPSQEEQLPISTLRDQLIDEEGIGLRSASHVFIDYRFSRGGGVGLQEEIGTLYFIFRPGPDQSDVPLLYLDTSDPWVSDVLKKKGTSLLSNEAALIPFRRQLGFARMTRPQDAKIVEIADQTVREGFEQKKKALLRKVRRLTYQADF